jgi:hypothetical protein
MGGTAIQDQGFQNREPPVSGDWGWFGASSFKKPARDPVM